MNKKAITKNYLLSLILVVVFIFIMMLFLSEYSKKVDTGTQKEICKDSVLMHGATKLGDYALDTDIKCPTQELKITSQDPEKIKYQMAKAMYDCWDQFAQGKLNLFGDEETIYCNICHLITFKHKNQEITGFQEYLATKAIPGKGGITYLDFIMNYETPNSAGVIPEMDESQQESFNEGIIDTSKTYATIFAYAKGQDQMTKIKNHLSGSTTPGEIGIAVGATAAGTVMVIILASNPIGWGVAAVAIIVGTIVYATTQLITFFFSTDNVPEWASFIIFKEYDAESLDSIGCEYIPLDQ